ncbi:MAG: tRNA preQ1(34) S-adenosylmethionine ribosyltransferase-isomerase QueA [Acidobacteria bacterium]|nr:tRNA preQ1(34) S-adenosylmethionine ribosyltransferase-isomerase QueA [Acidobacteriota bacterium]
MRVDEFDFHLPEAQIAQHPPDRRGTSRMLVLDRITGAIDDTTVADLPEWLRKGDVLVLNDTRVFPARLLGRRLPGGGRLECLLVQAHGGDAWDALVHPGQRLRVGSTFVCDGPDGAIHGSITGRGEFGRRRVQLRADGYRDVDAAIEAIGHVPLPPYIRRPDASTDRERYQTVFGMHRGSVAAPTAGLHFTPALLDAIRARGVDVVTITLHVGYGTFKPVRVDQIEDHIVDPERYEVPDAAAATINRAKAEGRRVVVVGTTSTRALESAVDDEGRVRAGAGNATMCIRPGHTFRVVDALMTNFHVPRSSLLFLVCAFAGRERVLATYAHAVANGYRFYSYGDAMLIVTGSNDE